MFLGKEGGSLMSVGLWNIRNRIVSLALFLLKWVVAKGFAFGSIVDVIRCPLVWPF